MNHLRNTFIGVAFAYVQIAVNLVQGLIITPMCLSQMSSTTFGAWLVTGNVLAWIGLLDPGVHLVIQQRIAAAHAHRDIQAIGRLRTQAYALASLFALFAFAAAMLAMPLHAVLVGRLGCEQPTQVAAAYLVAAFALAVFVASYGAAVVTLATQSPAAHGIIALVAQAAHLVLVIHLLRSGMGVVALSFGLLAQAAVNLFGNLAFAWLTMPPLAWPPVGVLDGLGGLMRETRAVFMGRAGAALAANSDMIIASWFLGAAPTVTLNITQRAPLMLRTLTERVSHAATPVLSVIDAERGDRGRGDATAAVVRAVIWLAIPAALVTLIWNRPFIGLWAGGEYYAGDTCNALVAFALVAASLEATFVNVCAAFGLYAASGRLLLAKSLLATVLACVGARFFGAHGLLVGPLMAGALTTWWVLPLTVGRHSAWNGRRWGGLGMDVVMGCSAAAAAAALATRIEVRDIRSLITAGFVFAAVYVSCLLCLSDDVRGVVIRAAGLAARRAR